MRTLSHGSATGVEGVDGGGEAPDEHARVEHPEWSHPGAVPTSLPRAYARVNREPAS